MITKTRHDPNHTTHVVFIHLTQGRGKPYFEKQTVCLSPCAHITTGAVALKGPPYFYLAGGLGDLSGDKVPQVKIVAITRIYCMF